MAETANGPKLHPVTAELAAGKNFATVSTVLPSGKIQSHQIWVGTQDARLVLNTEVHRMKHKNISRDPRVTVLIRDEHDPYRYAEVRGEVTATTTGEQAREHIDTLAYKYLGKDYPADGIKSERVIWWITPSRQTVVDQNRGPGTED